MRPSHHRLQQRFLTLTSLILSFVALAGCGSEKATPESANFDETNLYYNELGALSATESLVISEQFSGKLVVYLDESLGARFSANKGLTTKQSAQEAKLLSLQNILSQFSSVTLKPSTELDPEQLDKRRAELEKISGKKHRDWNSVIHLEVQDPVTAVKLMRQLQKLEIVKMISPGLQPQMFENTLSPAEASEAAKNLSLEKAGEDDEQTPDLSPTQLYLGSEEISGGLNVLAAWQQGVLGSDVWLVQAESGLSALHEDLPFRRNNGQILGGIACHDDNVDSAPFCRQAVAHGTAMAGIMTAIHENNLGIKGLAPQAIYKFGGNPLALQAYTDGLENALHNEIPPGSVFVVIEGASCPARPDFGCLPLTVLPEFYDMVEDASALGVTVIVGAGNGGQNLDSANSYYPNQRNLAANPSSAIIVGAADTSHNIIPESTFGSPVELFAWGRNVSSTAYPAPDWDWFLNLQPAPLNDRPDRFYANFISGTSPATALIGGAAALIQSQAKALLAAPVLNSDLPYENSRYLRPEKIKQFLYDSGVNQQDGSGHSIGRQPRLELALFGGFNEAAQEVEGVQQFIDRIFQDFPELNNQHGPIPQARMTALRNAGIGIVCKENNPEKSDMLCGFEYRCVPGDPERSDPDCPFEDRCIPGDPEGSAADCPENFIWPEGRQIAKALDFDGDGRADLVDWSSGHFKLDLSSLGNGELNFGAWDLELSYPAIPGTVVLPYVEDMNSDGRTDFVLYDKRNGRWYIRYTTSDLLAGGAFGNWSRVVNHSASWRDVPNLNPNNTRYSRPHPGDYNFDGWVDIAIACSDGFWRIDFGGPEGAWDGEWDQQVRYLDNARLAQAPGWAYQTYWDGFAINYKIPDTLPEVGRVVSYAAPDFDTSIDLGTYNPDNPSQPLEPLYAFGGNDEIFMYGFFPEPFTGTSVKRSDGSWPISTIIEDEQFNPIFAWGSPSPDGIFGGHVCHPIQAHFDDQQDFDDRAVFCPDGWKIALSRSEELVQVPLGYITREFHLPGRSYAGGIAYAEVLDIIEVQLDLRPNTAPAIPIDMLVTAFSN